VTKSFSSAYTRIGLVGRELLVRDAASQISGVGRVCVTRRQLSGVLIQPVGMDRNIVGGP
jgi:hypothetical protein